MLKMLLKLLKYCSSVPRCKRRDRHMRAQQRGLLGQECYKWLDCNSVFSVSTLPHIFPMFWINLSIEITESGLQPEHSLGLTTDQLAFSGSWSFSFSILPLMAQDRCFQEISLLHRDGDCCCSDFLEIRLLCTQGLWDKGWNMPFYQTLSCVSCHFHRQKRSHNTCPLKSPWVGCFKSRNWLVPASPLCQRCKCLLPKGYLGRSPSW